MKKKILITDDTEDILTNLQDFMIMEGYQVSIARNGKEALEQLKLEIPDLIITDLLMNEMTGFELIKELKKNDTYKKIPVLVFSAKPMDENQTLSDMEADRFVMKPAAPEMLLNHVRDLLHPPRSTEHSK